MNHAVYAINLKLKEKLQICMTTICTIISQVVLNTFVIWLNFVDFVMIQIMYSRKRVMVMIVLLEISRKVDTPVWILDAVIMLEFVSMKRIRIKLNERKSNISKKYNFQFGYIAKAP